MIHPLIIVSLILDFVTQRINNGEKLGSTRGGPEKCPNIFLSRGWTTLVLLLLQEGK